MEGRLVRRLKTAIGGVVISGAVVVGGPAAAGGAAAVGTVAVAMKAVAQVGQETKNRLSCDTAYVQGFATSAQDLFVACREKRAWPTCRRLSCGHCPTLISCNPPR